MSQPASSSRTPRVFVPILALVVLAGLGLSGLGGGEPAPDATPSAGTGRPSADGGQAPATAGTIPDMARREPGDPRAIGEVDAPVVMVEWSDFQCPFCGRFARETAPELVERYVEDGTLRIEWRDFPYLGPESTQAALAGRAAAAQGAFWAFHDAVFAEAIQPNTGALDRPTLLAMAAEAGLDVAAFEQTMDDPATADAVQREFDEAQRLGINGTPAFLINGRPVLGAQPLETFVQAIEAAIGAGA